MNELFLNRMKEYIPDEMDAYLASLEQPLFQGLRTNPLKTKAAFLQEALPYLKEPSVYAKDSWYIQGQHGLDPYHICGLFYLQEPSASLPVEALDVQPDDKVLDLCAAPGSKTTQIAGKLENGFLLSNEYDSKRSLSLLSNLERMGAENFMVTNMDTKPLCKAFPETFTKILVDAPCSGEGMMKKHQAARDEWSLDNVLLCAARQKEILSNAYQALASQGELVYSTCTYAKAENEEMVAWFLETYPDMEQVDLSHLPGRAGLETKGMKAGKVRRIFPMDKGEGHFVAKFRKTSGSQNPLPIKKSAKLEPLAEAFLKEQTDRPFQYYDVVKAKDSVQIYGMNHPFVPLKKGKVLRQGVYIGEIVKNRLEPAHAFYMSKTMLESSRTKTEVSLEQMDAFMHGSQLDLAANKGFRTVCFEGFPFGFGKSDGRRITNKIPKGMRLNPNSHVAKEGAQNDERA